MTLKRYKAKITHITESYKEYLDIYAQNPQDAEQIAKIKFRENYNFVCEIKKCEVTES